MKHHYHDIRDRIPIKPKWWDEHGVPRYCDFGPHETANIYADEVCLLLICCQGCMTPFKVCMSQSAMDRVNFAAVDEPYPTLGDIVAKGEIHYGDPPNMDCCPAGATMNSVPIRVLEFWQRQHPFDHERVPELEIDVHADWWDYDEEGESERP